MSSADSLGLTAVRLLPLVREAGTNGLIHVASGEQRAARIARILERIAPDLTVLFFPRWDCLPYDRAAPSREVMGRRMSALRRMAEESGRPVVVLATSDALVQRVPPRSAFAGVPTFRRGEPIDLGDLTHRMEALGYTVDERVDEPGEVAIRGQVVDLFPASAEIPYRVDLDEDRIKRIHCYDPLSQRTTGETETLIVDPASEVVLDGAADGEDVERFPGMEHWLAAYYPALETVFDYLPGARIVEEPDAEARRRAAWAQIEEAWRDRARLDAEQPGSNTARAPAPPGSLYLTQEEWDRATAGRVAPLPLNGEDGAVVPRFATERRPRAAFRAFLGAEVAAGRTIVLAAAAERDLSLLSRLAEQEAGRPPARIETWDAVSDSDDGALLAILLDFDRGFVDAESNVIVICAADLLGSRARSAVRQAAVAPWQIGDSEFRLSDTVIHMEHGVGILKDLETVETDTAGTRETVRLEYAKEAQLLAPVEDMRRIWRYGSEEGAVALDRLDSNAWIQRRAKVEAAVAETAQGLVALAREREQAKAPKLVPPQRDYERFVSRFPFVPTPDQLRAVEDTLSDLASGRPMDRLVVGDVGFGKTEVALRAAAAAALAGRQVALVAPTTVLVRQHVQTLQRRFAGLGIEVAHLSRLVAPAEARRVKQGLTDGSVRIVIGTHAVAAKGVAFQDLGLLIIDEEQRFGTAHKAKLRALARAGHVLTLTATPIPRTLQTALVGLQDLSLILTPPARRRPIRTFSAPFDPATVRAALLREQRRAGQSFVVVPRIEDIEPMAARLKDLVPRLEVLVAHGKLPPREVDETMVRFADGRGDVLLATNIIESGLDVPRANTMIVHRADLFGLAQLHQLRGRVGRGRAQGICYLLTEPDQELSEATARRLGTLEAFDRLGAGMAISARDLDLRGAGDLLGEEQAGHVKLIGLSLYQHLLERALRAARGLAVEDWTPEINIDAAGSIPADYVPEPDLRINLYARLFRLTEAQEIDALADELEDRFGPPPEPVETLLALARLRSLCQGLGIARIDAGPQAVAFTPRPDSPAREALDAASQDPESGLAWKNDRLIRPWATETPRDWLRGALEILRELE